MKQILTTLLLLIAFAITNAQTNGTLVRENAIDVYLDCQRCDDNYVKEEIQFVNFVRDRKEADVHIISNSIRTGGNGRQYTLTFFGLKNFDGIDDTLTYVRDVTDTDESERIKLVSTLKLGLIRYVNKSPFADRVEINYKPEDEHSPGLTQLDPWDFWVFRTSASTDFKGEEVSKSYDLELALTATRITEDWKFRLSFDNDYEETKFDYDDEVYFNIKREQKSFNYAIMSLDDHWSLGSWIFMQASTYRNIDFKISVAPGVEYNIFPYSDFNTKQLRLQYRLWNQFNNYTEETIYFKTSEFLLEQSISATLDLIQPWGSISTTVRFENYMHDFSKNSLNLRARVSLQLVKGLELTVRGGYSAIHNQLSLPKSGADIDEVLLQQRELETQYEFSGSLGISFTFGSIYNNIVNPRFGD